MFTQSVYEKENEWMLKAADQVLKSQEARR